MIINKGFCILTLTTQHDEQRRKTDKLKVEGKGETKPHHQSEVLGGRSVAVEGQTGSELVCMTWFKQSLFWAKERLG